MKVCEKHNITHNNNPPLICPACWLDNCLDVSKKLADSLSERLDAALKSEKEPEKEPETDWSKVEPGTLVEVRDCDNGKWIPGLFQSVLDDLDADYPYRIYTTREEHGDEDAYCAYRQCRLYQPESGWIDWDGGECPVKDDEWCIVMLRDGVKYFNHIHAIRQKYQWKYEVVQDRFDVVKYKIIDKPTDTGGEG